MSRSVRDPAPSITEFLEARITEDEAVAHATAKVPMKPGLNWRSTFKQIEGRGHVQVANCDSSWYADHIVRHDPARVLAECVAKRAILESCGFVDDRQDEYAVGLRDDTLTALAAVYADHPDYRQEWAA